MSENSDGNKKSSLSIKTKRCNSLGSMNLSQEQINSIIIGIDTKNKIPTGKTNLVNSDKKKGFR